MGAASVAITLISVSSSAHDEIGNPVKTETEHAVIADEIAVRGSEFYQAAQAGLKPERIFEVWAREYSDETKLRASGVTYRVIRTSLGKNRERLWLTCERLGTSG